MCLTTKLVNIFKQSRNNKLIQHTTRNYAQNILTSNELIIENLQGKYSGVTVFGMKRPSRKNALGVNLVKQLDEELDMISDKGKARVLIVRSLVKDIFCSGADLKERIKMSPSEVSIFVKKLRSVVNKFHQLPIPVIAAMDGSAFGGGLEIALACDIRIVSANIKLGLVETKLAIIPGAGGTQRLPRLINPAVAKELIYTARIIDGKKAQILGIANHCVDQNESGDASYLSSLDLCEEMLRNGPLALKMAKTAINKGLEVDLHTGLAIEEACYAQVIPTKDRTEALEAFQNNRVPNFVGE
ncbi:hypothetical protein WA026_010644 [Henosepilachna vigintioctopunctata]|uniref:Methylglutaconyl-CoA hydratase, mitochondrial n=1 Tax=Henosepilachna vigintioctopunctata TaxID=420089 RepID=A0AAW1UNE4_9CUCU